MGTNRGLTTVLILSVAVMMVFSILPAMAGGPPPDKVPFKVSDDCATSSTPKCLVFIDVKDDGCDTEDKRIQLPRKIAMQLTPCGL